MAARPHPVLVVLLVLTNLYVVGAGLYITFVGFETHTVEEGAPDRSFETTRSYHPIGLLFALLGIGTVLPLFFGRYDIPWVSHAALSMMSLILIFSAGLFLLPAALLNTVLLAGVELRTKALKRMMQPE